MAVLFVDNDMIVLKMLSSLAQFADLDYDAVGSGKAALEMLATRHFDVVVTDVNMTDMDGVELALKIHERFKATPVYGFTGGTERYTYEELNRFFDKLFEKPHDTSRLIAELMQCILIGENSLPC